MDNFMLNERVAERRTEMVMWADRERLVRLALGDGAAGAGTRAALASMMVRVALLVDANAGSGVAGWPAGAAARPRMH